MELGRAWRGGAAWPSFKERGRAAEFVDHSDADAYRKLSARIENPN